MSDRIEVDEDQIYVCRCEEVTVGDIRRAIAEGADTLKAIKCEGAQVILEAAGWGPETPEQMERYIKKNEKNPRKQFEVKRLKKALPFMRKLKWT